MSDEISKIVAEAAAKVGSALLRDTSDVVGEPHDPNAGSTPTKNPYLDKAPDNLEKSELSKLVPGLGAELAKHIDGMVQRYVAQGGALTNQDMQEAVARIVHSMEQQARSMNRLAQAIETLSSRGMHGGF